MRLYDTARQAVVPIEGHDGRVGMYVCGITPYDAAHLGHAFVYHVFDVITRRLRHDGVSVRSVRNITDVDDDILRVARARNVDFRALADNQIARFVRDMDDINILPVDAAPRATEHVPAMVRWIERLQERGVAYERDGTVFFDTARDPSFGSLSRLPRDAMIQLSRERGGVPDDPRVRDPRDFVLWQRSAPDEPSWPSPWGDGRPGWHIECSVLASSDVGTPIDIHGGGDDLVYPHHEAEIAQADGAGISQFARHWVHVAMVQLDGVKMSKSLGNLVFVRDLLTRVPAASIRLLLAAHHHRTPWSYEEVELAAADERRRRYEAFAAATIGADDAARLERDVLERLDDDLDTPGALAVLDRAAARAGGGTVAAAEVLHPLLALLGAAPASVPA